MSPAPHTDVGLVRGMWVQALVVPLFHSSKGSKFAGLQVQVLLGKVFKVADSGEMFFLTLAEREREGKER